LVLINIGSIFKFLQSPSCMIESLDLGDNHFDDRALNHPAKALINNHGLRKLLLNCISYRISPEGWSFMGQYLRSPSRPLESLQFCYIRLNDEIALSLAVVNFLSGNSRLRELVLTPCTRDGNTTTNWGAFTTALHNPNSALEIQDLSNNNSIADHVIDSFAESLINGHKLEELIVSPRIASRDICATLTRMLCGTSSMLTSQTRPRMVLNRIVCVYTL
jgi:hypothetical protein